jgi:hypothetical protein
LTVPSGGKFQIGVIGMDASGYYNVEVAEFDSDGTLDSSFGSAGVYAMVLSEGDNVFAVGMTSGGNLVVAGYSTAGDGFFVAEFEWSA